MIISNSFLTCFSKALGTSLRSSDKLWLMRSLRLFSMICIRKKKQTELQTQLKKRQNRLTSNDLIHSPLFSSFEPESARRCLETWTQWLGCTAKIVLKQESEMSKKGHRGRKKKNHLIFLHIVIITLLNMTQRQDGTPTPFNLICFLGTEKKSSARERREDEIVFTLMHFWTLVSVKWHAVLLSVWAKALLEKMII